MIKHVTLQSIVSPEGRVLTVPSVYGNLDFSRGGTGVTLPPKGQMITVDPNYCQSSWSVQLFGAIIGALLVLALRAIFQRGMR